MSVVEHHPEPMSCHEMRGMCMHQMYTPRAAQHARILHNLHWFGIAVHPWMANTAFNVEMCQHVTRALLEKREAAPVYSQVMYTPRARPPRRVRRKKPIIVHENDVEETNNASSDAESSDGSIDFDDESIESDWDDNVVEPSSPVVVGTCD